LALVDNVRLCTLWGLIFLSWFKLFIVICYHCFYVEYWKNGMLEKWNTGKLEKWKTWNVGKLNINSKIL